MVATIAFCACSAPQQQTSEASITYRVSFTAEQGVSSAVIFPFPVDAGLVFDGLTVSDGGTAMLKDQANEGIGLGFDAHGAASAAFTGKMVKGFGDSMGPPDVTLSMQQPDAGPSELYLRVNKGGAATIHVAFEFTASRDCGKSCGGTRSWKFEDDIGITLQPVHMTYVEEHR